MTFKPVRKAIFPVGGLGARFLPATKAMPKEMLPIVDSPLIQYAVEEAKAAGIEQFIFVTGRGKAAIEDHFDHSYELHATLTERGRKRSSALIADLLPLPGQVAYIRQQHPNGLGHAVWCARHLAAGEPVAVLLADDMVMAAKSLPQADDRGVHPRRWQSRGGDGCAARAHRPLWRAGTGPESGRLVEVSGLVEKPKPGWRRRPFDHRPLYPAAQVFDLIAARSRAGRTRYN